MVDICNDVVVAEGGKDVVAYINNLSFEKFQLVSKVGLNLWLLIIARRNQFNSRKNYNI